MPQLYPTNRIFNYPTSSHPIKKRQRNLCVAPHALSAGDLGEVQQTHLSSLCNTCLGNIHPQPSRRHNFSNIIWRGNIRFWLATLLFASIGIINNLNITLVQTQAPQTIRIVII
jgi:hypothetical protein